MLPGQSKSPLRRPEFQAETCSYSRNPLDGWFILAISVYALGSAAFAVCVFLGPMLDPGRRVLRIGNLKVDQFYFSLALSTLLAPAAVIIRRITHDMALLHPFAVPSASPMRVADFDIMMDPGVKAAAKLKRYSVSSASVQGFLRVAGAYLMPPKHVRLAPDTLPIYDERLYYGIIVEKLGKVM